MTTTPETIAELKRLLKERGTGSYVLRYKTVKALPSLLSDLEASQKREQVLRDALDWMIRCHTRDTDNDPNWQIQDQDHAVERARAALAATGAK
jgi:hypothetical protein